MRAALLVGEDEGREIMGVKMTVGFQRLIRVNGSMLKLDSCWNIEVVHFLQITLTR